MGKELLNSDKELLLKDLCGRLPYKVKVKYYDSEDERDSIDVVEGIEDIYSTNPKFYISQYALTIGKFKPYLFPLSSLKDEQKEELVRKRLGYYQVLKGVGRIFFFEKGYEVYDWVNEHHFDYRGLINKGLAIDASNKNIY